VTSGRYQPASSGPVPRLASPDAADTRDDGPVSTEATHAAPPEDRPTDGRDEVVGICQDLIRIPSVNRGDGSGPGERAAAEYVAGLLAEVGLQPEVFESAPGRASVVARWEGADPARDGLLVHGHTDVVPADAADWKVDPFSGELLDDCVWGRGAVDMKDMDAMVLAVVRARVRAGRPPARPVVLAFTADEEAGSALGAGYLVDHHRDLFDGCTEGISEVGGFSVTLDNDRRLYLVQSAEKGIAWLRLKATGVAGHGSMIQRDNAVSTLARAVTSLSGHRWPLTLTPTVRELLTSLADLLEVSVDLDDEDAVRALVARLGPLSRMVGATLTHTLNPTMLQAGYKANVVPAQATATLDGRFLPGGERDFLDTVDRLLPPGVVRETIHSDVAVEEPWTEQLGSGGLVDTMIACLTAADPEATVLPYTMSGGTDGKVFSRLGIASYGFAPLQLPPGLDFSGMFHGIDERVPVDALRFGVGVLDSFFDRA